MEITDKQRLNWLSRKTLGHEIPEISEVRYARPHTIKKAWSLRQAIDAAIRAERGK